MLNEVEFTIIFLFPTTHAVLPAENDFAQPVGNGVLKHATDVFASLAGRIGCHLRPGVLRFNVVRIVRQGELIGRSEFWQSAVRLDVFYVFPIVVHTQVLSTPLPIPFSTIQTKLLQFDSSAQSLSFVDVLNDDIDDLPFAADTDRHFEQYLV